jgi:hypothetical protein
MATALTDSRCFGRNVSIKLADFAQRIEVTMGREKRPPPLRHAEAR